MVHVTGPSDVGMLGAFVAHDLKLPLVASWHTNIHEFGARRLSQTLSFIPAEMRRKIAAFTEQRVILALACEYYRPGRVLLAPKSGAGGAFAAAHGAADVLDAARRRHGIFLAVQARSRRKDLVIGYVGRLSPEKSVRTLRDVEQALLAAGVKNFRFSIVGDGHEQELAAG